MHARELPPSPLRTPAAGVRPGGVDGAPRRLDGERRVTARERPPTSALPTPADRPSPGAPASAPRLTMVKRGLRSAGFGVVIALLLSALTGRNLWKVLAYSLSIAICCWFLIDTGRLLVARRLHRRAAADGREAGSDWPGWRWMAFVVLFGSLVGYSAGTAIGNAVTGIHSPGLLGATTPREALALLLLGVLPALAITYFFHSRGVIAEQQAQVQIARAQAAEHQLKLLESQLQPHMLFNTLANLRVLIALDPARAQAMLDQLIAFLRATLNASRASEHSLGAEFARLADYLALMQVRMGSRLETRLDLPDALARIAVPPLLLQPLVENCIAHGLEPKVAGGRIDVSAHAEGGELVLTVRDTGVGLAAPGTGTRFGLVQVRERLATLYADRASLALADAPAPEGGAIATIRLPLPAP